MKIIMGIVPCKDRFFLDKALMVIKPGIEEVVALTNEEDSYFKVVSELYSGVKQLEMIYLDDQDTPVKKEQAAVISKLLADPAKDYVGYAILEFWMKSLHIYQAYFQPQYRGLHFLKQGYDNVERQARLVGAPYISLCTMHGEEAKHFGFAQTYSMFRKKL